MGLKLKGGIFMKKVYEIRKPTKTTIAVNEDRLTITRKGLLNTLNIGLSGNKTIRLKQVTSLQLKLGTNLTNGYLQLGLLGDSSHRQGLFNATQDENTIMFSKKYNDDMQELHDYIDNYSENPIENETPQAKSVTEELKEYKELLDMEIITQEEFEAKKKELLNL